MCAAVVLSLDAADTTGEHAATSSLASNGEIHKIRLNLEGQRIGLGEYIGPQRYGFMLSKPREVVYSSSCIALACCLMSAYFCSALTLCKILLCMT